MLLEWVNNLGLLEYDKDSNVLLCFPQSIRKNLITEVVTYLHQVVQSGHVTVTSGATVSVSTASTPTVLMNTLAASTTAAGAPYAVTSVTPTENGLGALTTVFHVRWVMEVVGQAFNLPLEDINIIGQAASIYIQWLMEPEKRPLAIQRADFLTQQTFLQSIFRHISLLFQAKRVDGVGAAKPLLATLASKHVEICKLMLRTLGQIANTFSLNEAESSSSPEDEVMSNSTWKVLLRVMLGVTDYLLRMPCQPYCYLAEELGETLISIFIEIWLRSQTFSTELWKALKVCYPGWTHRMIAITQWSTVSLALTQRVTRLLYGQGTNIIVYTIHSNLISLQLEDRFVVYAWYQMLLLLGNLSTMPPSIFFRSVLGMEKLVQVFHSIGLPRLAEASTTISPLERNFPDGNTLLKLFGPWLFEAVNRSGSDCSEGRAQAFGILCRIFSRRQYRSPFLTTYLNQFYAAIIGGLKSDLLSLVFIIVNCEDVFSLGLPGSRILFAPMVMALKRLIPNLEKPLRVSLNMDDLRRACYKLLCTISSSCLCYGSVPISSSVLPSSSIINASDVPLKTLETNLALNPPTKTHQTSSSHSTIGSSAYYLELVNAAYKPKFSSIEATIPSFTMSHLRRPILELLIYSFCEESDPGNLRYLINSLTVFVMDEAVSVPTLPSLLVELLENYLAHGDPTTDVCLVATESLTRLALHENLISQQRSETIYSLVSSLSGLVSTFLARNNLPLYFKVITALLECTLKWICGVNNGSIWLTLDDNACLSTFLQVLTKTTSIAPSKKLESSETTPTTISRTSFTSISSPSPSISQSPSMIFAASSTKPLEIQLSGIAESILARLIHYFGLQRSNIFFPTRCSSLATEATLLNNDSTRALSSLTPQEIAQLRYFVLNGNRIACYLERQENNSEITLIGVIRSMAGRFTWASNLRYQKKSSSPAASVAYDPIGEDLIEFTPIEKPQEPKLMLPYQSTLIDSAKVQNQLVKEHPELRGVPITITEDGILYNERWSADRFASDDKRVLNYKCIEDLALQQVSRTLTSYAIDSRGVKIYRARPTPVASAKGEFSRLFLAHTGLVSSKCRESVIRLPSCPELLADLQILDSLYERDTISVSILYIKSARQSLAEILSSTIVSADFQAFIVSLGWPANVDRHIGFLGSYASDYKSSSLAFPYFADSSVEVVFHLPHLLTERPEKDMQVEVESSKRNQTSVESIKYSQSPIVASLSPQIAATYLKIVDDLVAILWLEDLEDMLTLPNTLQTRAMVYICINPLRESGESSGLYRIRIMVTGTGVNVSTLAITPITPVTVGSSPSSPSATNNPNSSEAVFLFGPLLDGMIIRRELLSQVVRDTAISASLFCLYHVQNLPRPLTKRSQYLQHIINKYSPKAVSIGKYYNELIYNCGP